MDEYNYINDLMTNHLSKMFYSISDKSIPINEIVTPKVIQDELDYQNFDFSDECKNFYRFIVRKKIEANTIHSKMIDFQLEVVNDFSKVLYAKFYKIQKEEDFYNDLSSLFESENGKNSFLKEIEEQKVEYKKLYEACSKFIVKYISLEILFYIVNVQYIIRTYNNEQLHFINDNGSVETDFVAELIINFYNESLILYVNEVNRIQRINQTLKIIEESFFEYCKLGGEERALKLFESFIEKDPKNFTYKIKSERDIKFFTNFHEYYLYYVINHELLRNIHKNRGRFTSHFRISHAEEILFRNFSKAKYDKILVKTNEKGEKSIFYNTFSESFLAIEHISDQMNFCFVNNNQLFLYDLNISKIEYKEIKKAIFDMLPYETKIEENLNYLLNKKYKFKHYEKSFRETFLDICMKFSKCLTKSKPSNIVAIKKSDIKEKKNIQKPINKINRSIKNNLRNSFKNVPILSKLVKNGNEIKLESRMSLISEEGELAKVKTYENQFYDKRIFLVAKSGGLKLQSDQLNINLVKLINYSDPSALNEQGCNVLFTACEFLNHEFVKLYLTELNNMGFKYDPNIENSEGITSLQILFLIFSRDEIVNYENIKLKTAADFLLTLKRLLKYSFEGKNIVNINVNVPVDNIFNTPIHKAILADNDKIVSLLLEYGDPASVKLALQSANKEGKTVLDLCTNKKSKIYELIKAKLQLSSLAFKAKYEPQKQVSSAFNYVRNKIAK